MILAEHIPAHNRLSKYMNGPMLMLGNQSNECGFQFPCAYQTLDPDGGDFKIDLNNILTPDLSADQYKAGASVNLLSAFETVYNLGTLEHVWDVNQAYENAAKMVRLNGHFIGHSPVAGYEGHGIHVTSPGRIIDFFRFNGFNIVDMFFTDQQGRECGQPERNCGRSIILWFAAQRVGAFNYIKPQQVYKNGVKG